MNWLMNGDDPNRSLRFGEPMKDRLLRGKKVRDDVAKRMNIRDPYTPAADYPNHVLFGFEAAEDGFQIPLYIDLGDQVVSQSIDMDTGAVRTTTTEIVAAGTAATAIDNDGMYSTVRGMNTWWSVKTLEQATGLAGSAVNGKAERTIERHVQHYWPPVLSGLYLRLVYADPMDAFSAVTGYISQEVWGAHAYNGSCKARVTERWTKVQPTFDGDPNWPATGTEPYLPVPTTLMPRPINYRGVNFSFPVESCLHPAFIFTDAGYTYREPATIQTNWPGTKIADCDVRPYLGGWMTTTVEIDAPIPDGYLSSPGVAKDLVLTWAALTTTSVRLSFVAGADTTLDVSTTPDFTSAMLLNGVAVSDAATSYDVTSMVRGTTYYARLTRDGETSNVVQMMATPAGELTVANGQTPIATAGTLAYANTVSGSDRAVTLTLENIGVLHLRDVEAALSGTNANQWTLGTVPTSVLRGSEESLVLTFEPTSAGSKTAVLTITSEDSAPYVINLTGTATAPEINVKESGTSYATGSNVDIAGVVAGTATDVTLTIENTGTGNLNLGTVSISGSGWSVITQPTAAVAGGGSTTAVVRCSQTVAGASVGVVTIPSDDLDEPSYTLNLVAEVTATPVLTMLSPWGGVLTNGATLNMGRLANGTRALTVTLRNDGFADLNGLVVGGSGSGYSLGAISGGAVSLAPNATATVTITVTTSTDGTYTGTLTITSDDPITPLFTLNLTTVDVAAATSQTQLEQPTGTLLTTGVSSIDFGNIVVASGSLARTFTYRNIGATTSGTLAGAVTGTHSADFVQAGLAATVASTAASVGSDDFTVTFDPSGFGPRTATLTVTDTTDSPSVDFAVSLTGVGIPTNALLTGSAATVIIGQLDADDQNSVASDIITPGPVACAISSTGKLAVADATAGKVYIWNTVPTSSGTAANIVLTGQTSGLVDGFTPSGVAWHGANLWVSDSANHRVLRWTNPTTAAQNASLVLGQANFSSQTANRGGAVAANTLSNPQRIIVAGTKLILADTDNNRVLIWNTIPTVNGQAASVAVGQASLTTNASGTTASTLNAPRGVAVVGGRLVVADTGNHRVLQYALIPTSSGPSASFAQGQANLTSGSANRGGAAAANTLNTPSSVSCHPTTGALVIADTGNNRVIVFYDTPTNTGGNAHAVLGQANFTTTTAATSSGSVMSGPTGVCFTGTDLLVSGDAMKRTMFFDSV